MTAQKTSTDEDLIRAVTFPTMASINSESTEATSWMWAHDCVVAPKSDASVGIGNAGSHSVSRAFSLEIALAGPWALGIPVAEQVGELRTLLLTRFEAPGPLATELGRRSRSLSRRQGTSLQTAMVGLGSSALLPFS